MNDRDTPPPPASAATLSHVSVHFGAVQAVKDVSLSLAAGRIYGFVGANGAGKSTVLGALAGRVTVTSGDVSIGGRPIAHPSPRIMRAAGVASIYQELTIAPAMTALSNVFLGAEQTRAGILNRRDMVAAYGKLCQRLGVDIPRGAKARSLSLSQQQSLEIMRAIQLEASLLLFDEPTSALAESERRQLFRVMSQLRDEGRTVVFVTHDLEEVLGIADEIMVFRDGRLIESRPAADWTKPQLVEAMLGQAVVNSVYVADRIASEESFGVTGLSSGERLRDISFSCKRGEILGIAGLVGAGKSSMLRTLAGQHGGKLGGEVRVHGERHAVPGSVGQARKIGIAFIPEDRKVDGLLLGRNSLQNIVVPDLRGFPLGQVNKQSIARARDAAARVGFDGNRLRTPARELSGGNQQKLLLARWAREDVSVLLADEPTRGIDVGAKAEIWRTLREMATAGTAVVIASSELEELEEVCDEVIVLRSGRQQAVLRRDNNELTVERMLHSSFESEEIS